MADNESFLEFDELDSSTISAFIKLQAFVRGFLVRRLLCEIRQEYEDIVKDIDNNVEVYWSDRVGIPSVKKYIKQQNHESYHKMESRRLRGQQNDIDLPMKLACESEQGDRLIEHETTCGTIPNTPFDHHQFVQQNDVAPVFPAKCPGTNYDTHNNSNKVMQSEQVNAPKLDLVNSSFSCDHGQGVSLSFSGIHYDQVVVSEMTTETIDNSCESERTRNAVTVNSGENSSSVLAGVQANHTNILEDACQELNGEKIPVDGGRMMLPGCDNNETPSIICGASDEVGALSEVGVEAVSSSTILTMNDLVSLKGCDNSNSVDGAVTVSLVPSVHHERQVVESDVMNDSSSLDKVEGESPVHSCDDSVESAQLPDARDSNGMDREGQLKDLPDDKNSLLELKKTLTMELLWIQQAINSRKHYLHLKQQLAS